MIVKLQKSLPRPKNVLIYNKSRKIRYEAKMSKEIKKLFPKDVYKIFHYATYKKRTLTIDEKAKDQNW